MNSGANNLLGAIAYNTPPKKQGAWLPVNLHGFVLYYYRMSFGANNLLGAISYKTPPKKPGAWLPDNLHGIVLY
jgi:hypothetical protein